MFVMHEIGIVKNILGCNYFLLFLRCLANYRCNAANVIEGEIF